MSAVSVWGPEGGGSGKTLGQVPSRAGAVSREDGKGPQEEGAARARAIQRIPAGGTRSSGSGESGGAATAGTSTGRRGCSDSPATLPRLTEAQSGLGRSFPTQQLT